MKKIFFKILLIFTIIFSVAGNSTADNKNYVDIDVSSMKQGVTVYFHFDKQGNVVDNYVKHGNLPTVKYIAPNDGIIDVAIFHLGFTEWKNSTGRLYYTIKADEHISNASGRAYVKSTSFFGPTYYDESFNHYFNQKSTGFSKSLKSKVYVGNETKVRVGFKNVKMRAVADKFAYLTDSSSIVEKK